MTLLVLQKEAAAAPAGKHTTDEPGLFLIVSATGRARWVLRYRPTPGKDVEVTIGTRDTMALAAALTEARAIKAGSKAAEPIMLKKKREVVEAAPGVRTFRIAAEELIADRRPEWRNEKHAAQWPSTLQRFVYPWIGARDVKDIGVEDVIQCLRPIWKKAETAKRVRSRIDEVLMREAALGNRDYRSPADKRIVETILGKHAVVRPGQLGEKEKAQGRRGPQAAMELEDLFEFVAHLYYTPGTSHRALLFLIFTGAREGAVLKADWSEMDLERRLWTAPGAHMKGGVEFVTPLSKQAVGVLESLGPMRNGLVFPSPRLKGMMSDAAMDRAVQRWCEDNNKPHATVHGMRRTTATAMLEEGFSEELVDRCLQHASSVKLLRKHYTTGDPTIENRRPLMDWWGRRIEEAITAKVLA